MDLIQVQLLVLQSGDFLDALEDRINGTVALGRDGLIFAFNTDGHVNAGNAMHDGMNFQVVEGECSGLVTRAVIDQRDDVFVSDVFLVVGQILEPNKGILKRVFANVFVPRNTFPLFDLQFKELIVVNTYFVLCTKTREIATR